MSHRVITKRLIRTVYDVCLIPLIFRDKCLIQWAPPAMASGCYTATLNAISPAFRETTLERAPDGMTLRVLICDDSAMARKQMARALPPHWTTHIGFAEHGRQALEMLRNDSWDVLFLDLNMPELDGYSVLQAIVREDLPVMTIVVSGDIQPQARERVLKLGALGFIRKPTHPDQVAALLRDYGLYRDEDNEQPTGQPPTAAVAQAGDIDLQGFLQEIANVAMGQASDQLARLLNAFIRLPVPKVARLARSELYMAISAADNRDTYSAVCQGFTGAGLSGEALLLFTDSHAQELSTLLGYELDEAKGGSLEVLMDLSSILFGAFIKSLGDQLDLKLSLSHPAILGQHQQVGALLEHHGGRQEELQCIEIRYEIENHQTQCDLLVVLTQDSIPHLEYQLQFLAE